RAPASTVPTCWRRRAPRSGCGPPTRPTSTTTSWPPSARPSAASPPRTAPPPPPPPPALPGPRPPYPRAYLPLRHGAVRAAKADAFVFATRLTWLSRPLAGTNPDLALRRAVAAAPDWSGGTRMGEALRSFNDDHGRRGMARGAGSGMGAGGGARGG